MTREEFETAVGEHRSNLVRFAISELGDEDVAEDAVQQTLMELYQECHRFNVHGPASVKTWLITRLKSRCMDEQRRRARHSLVSLQSLREDDNGEPEYEDRRYTVRLGYEDELHNEQTLTTEVDERKALTKLPDDLVNVAYACLIKKQTQEEAAESLGLSRDQVARKLDRARDLLARELAAYRPTGTRITETEVA